MNNKILWNNVLAELELSLSKAEFSTFFQQTAVSGKENNLIEISCPSLQTKERIETRHYQKVKRILDRLLKEDVELSFSITSQTKTSDKPWGPLFSKSNDEEGDPVSRQIEAGLSPYYTFDNYIVGPNNNLAHAVARAIAQNPGQAYNPFFLYSGVGLGKTHLLQAIGNEIIKNHPKLRVIYCTSETFMNELLESIQEARAKRGTASRFRSKFRKVDVLLIDDVQFIAGRDSTQEEFFHTFNALHQQRKQICITSDRPPKEIAHLEDRLSSRFASGMIADMQPPNMDLRIALLRNQRTQMHLDVPDPVVEFIAKTVSSNVRELEGAFLQVVTFVQASGKDYSLELAAQALGKTQPSAPQTTVRQIMKIVAEHFAVSQNDLKGKRRLKEVVLPRQIAMYLLREYTDTSLIGVGEVLGGRDHTTIMHGVDKIASEISANKKLQQDLLQIKQELGLPLQI